MNETINVLYLVWGERVTHGGIFDNQVVEQLTKIKELNPSIQIKVLSGFPYAKRDLTDKGFRQSISDELKKKKEKLKDHNIDFIVRKILILAFYANVFLLPQYYIWHFFYLKKLIVKEGIHVLHCRSYHATLLAWLTKRVFRLSYKIIFDTRSLFPEEGVSFGIFSEKSISFKFWKWIEEKLLNSVDAVVTVSETLTEHINRITSNPNVLTIPTSTNISIFNGRNLKERMAVREKLNLKDSKVLVYLGTIDSKSWYSIDTLALIYTSFRRYFPQTGLLLITQSPREALISHLMKYDIPEEEVIYVSTNTPQMTYSYLQAADYSALPFKQIHNNIDKTLGNTMLASKSGEYLASGLPIIIYPKMGAIGDIIDDHGLGCIYEKDEETMKKSLEHLETNYNKMSQSCISFAREHFDSQKHAEQYIALYNRLNEA